MSKLCIVFAFLMMALLTPSHVLPEESIAHGQYWHSMSLEGKVRYLQGYKDGSIRMWAAWFRSPDNKGKMQTKSDKYMREIMNEMSLTDVDMVVLSKVMTSLYDDPANTYINLSDMIPIARDKFAGKPIEDRLLRARQYGLREYKYFEKKEMEKQKR